MKLQIWPDAGLNQGGEDLFVAGVVYPANSEEVIWRLLFGKTFISKKIMTIA